MTNSIGAPERSQGSAIDINRTAAHGRETRHLSQKEVARRWGLSHRSLERWRIQGTGPQFMKINGRCRYRLEDIEEFEREHLRHSTAPGKPGARP